MGIFESHNSVSLREEIDELRTLINRNPAEALSLVDALMEKSGQFPDLEIKAEVFHIKGLALHQTHQFSPALECYFKALELRKECSDRKGEAITLNNIGLIYHDTGKLKEAIEYYEDALVIKKELNDYKSITATYENLGVAFQKISDFKKATEMFYASLKISEQHNDLQRISTTYQNIGVVHFVQGDYSYALTQFHKALDLKKESGDKTGIIHLTINIGATLQKLNRFDEAIRYFKECLLLSEEIDFKAGLAAANNNLGEIYSGQKKYQQAIEVYLKCYSIAENAGNVSDKTAAAINLGDAYLLINNLSEAERYLKEGLELGIKVEDLQHQQQACFHLSKLHEMKGSIQIAFDYFKKQDGLKSKILDIGTMRGINELKTKYEVDKKEKQNEINRLRNIELKEALDSLTIEKRKSEELLLNILPEGIADEMKKNGKVKARYFDAVSVMFLDIKDFTQHSEHLSPDELVSILDFYICSFDDIIAKYKVEKIKTIGDAYLCVSGLPNANNDHAIAIIGAAVEMRDWMKQENEKRQSSGQTSFYFRFGIHSGPVIAGIVGKAKYEFDIWGDSVNTANRMEQSGEVGKINISGDTYQLVKDKFNCTHRGKVEAKNKGQVDMYFVESAK